MSQNKTAEQVKEEHIDKMGYGLGTIYNSLYNEIIWMYYKWIEYKELFGAKESRIDLMNRTAPFFFFVAQKILWENVLLGIARITDRPLIQGKKTVTIKAIPQFISDSNFRNEIEKKIEIVLSESKFCRDWRNRHIAHKDYSLSIDKNAAPLEPANRLKVEDSFQAIFSVMNALSQKYLQSTTAYQFLSSDRGAVSLLQTIDDGLIAREELFARLKAGNFDEMDLKRKRKEI